MYTAISVLLGAMFVGRLCRRHINQRLTGVLVSASIFILLFLLGTSLGANDLLFRSLPALGLRALVLMLCCVAGSIACSWLVQKIWFYPHSHKSPHEK